MNFQKTIVLTFLLFLIKVTLAQNSSIKGILKDQQDNQPIEYASVALLKSDSTVIAGTITKSNGSFEFLKLQPGSYILKYVFIGYENKYSPVINLALSKNVNVGSISLNPGSELLNQVTITGEKINALNKIDKQSYRADQFESAKGGSAIDVLKNLPSVSVNGEGQISVRGSTGFLVLVNGKPVLTDAQTVLSQLPANSLENIELITSPSAKYDPDGKAGIINIVTKKGANDGFTLSANAQAGLPSTTDYDNKEQPKRFGGDVTLNYRKGKWDISVGGNYTRNDNAGYREGDVFTKNFNNNTITRFPSNGERSFDKYNYAGRLSAIYSADKNNSFSIGFFSGKRYQARLADLLYNNTTSDLSTGSLIKSTTYYNSNLQTKEGNFTLGNFDYTHTFANKSSLTASVLYENADLFGNTKNRNLKYPNTADTIQYVYNPYKNPINGYRFKLDYVVNIGEGKLESGYQFRYDTQDGQFDYFVTPATSQPDADRFRGTAKAKNQINSVYSQYSGKVNKLEYIGGLRYEYAARTVDLSYDPVPHKLNLSNLFPSLNLLYNFSDGLKGKAGYSRRIQRTNNYELNPIPEREHSETLEQGDPDLLPSFIDLAELGLIRTFNKGSFFTTLYYQNIKNPIQRVNSVYADTILNRVFTNAERAHTFGIEAGTNLQPVKWWSLYLGVNVYNYKIDGDLNILGKNSVISNDAWVYSINGNTNFKLTPTWSLQGNLNYLSNRPTAQGEDSRFLIPNASLKKTFMAGRFSATLQWQNIDLGMNQSNRQRITTSGRDFYTTTNYIYETDVFLLNFSFNLNKLTGKSKLPNSEFGDKEF
ncbi:TonB-dependent receptor domain-containing protein [Albibacterium bauzanense]|uniref:Outer membrane receptor protein involved in Fe transport n=1 Tax=Albibacterium bauzanense TaxID=653929 RepID=A0A4R1M206_9SPHI|nr:TonB-dependent receptor [Albibacterium bauzanense]TCK83649.1 outer membrane receptor protein involved in Fe transport [Albibacterium bauzanense]